MTIKQIDKKLKKIKSDLNLVEKELLKEKLKTKKDKTSKRISKSTGTGAEWKKLRLEVSGLWDAKLNSVEEIRAQRNRE